MAAFNVVRFRVKEGEEDALVEKYRNMKPDHPGVRRYTLIKTGERSYCLVGEWDNMSSIVDARPAMVSRLDSLRDMLEDLGGELGVTDAVSGEVIVDHTS